MVSELRAAFHALVRCRGYRPQPITLRRFRSWLRQFDPDERRLACELARRVHFISEREVSALLLRQYQELVTRLSNAQIPLSRTIFVSFDEAGSSSAVALHALRDAARLPSTSATLIDARDASRLQERLLQLIDEGDRPFAIVYVDDFVGTGTQFAQDREYVAQFYLGKFQEFLLSAVMCEEGIHRLGALKVAPLAGRIHGRSDRALLAGSGIFAPHDRDRLIAVARRRIGHDGLGWQEMATMVVLYSNAPDSTPGLLTGDYQHLPQFEGLFPRVQDLPAA